VAIVAEDGHSVKKEEKILQLYRKQIPADIETP
jgi:hypothetical protein